MRPEVTVLGVEMEMERDETEVIMPIRRRNKEKNAAQVTIMYKGLDLGPLEVSETYRMASQ